MRSPTANSVVNKVPEPVNEVPDVVINPVNVELVANGYDARNLSPTRTSVVNDVDTPVTVELDTDDVPVSVVCVSSYTFTTSPAFKS